MSQLSGPPCDCLNNCGDDPWLKEGRSTPCKNLLKHNLQAAQRQVLFDFYEVTNIVDLVIAQAAHVQRLMGWKHINTEAAS